MFAATSTLSASSSVGERCWAVVPAAGYSLRMGGEIPKQYLPLTGRTVLEHALNRLGRHPAVVGVVVVVAPDDPHWGVLKPDLERPVYTGAGGAERAYSVLNGLRLLAEYADPRDWVLVHDAARPCVRASDIDELIGAAREHSVGALLGVPVTDTVKRADAADQVQATVDRTGLWRALTPQMFRLGPLTAALQAALDAGARVTDEASAMELAGQHPRMVSGHADNIKVTHPQDLPLAELYLEQQERLP